MSVNSGDTEPAAPPMAAAEKPNPFQRIGGVLFSPVETFESISKRPDFAVTLLLLVVIGYISTALVLPRMDFDAMFSAQSEAIRKQNPNASDADLEKMQRIMTATARVMAWASPVLMVIWYLIIASVLLLAFRMMGGEGTFKQAFSATVYSWMPMVLSSIIGVIVVMSRGSFDPTTAPTLVRSNLAFLVEMKEQPVLFSLLAAIDIFTIWTLILLIIGFAALSRMSKVKSAAIVISLWLVLLVIRVGFAALGAARMKA